MESAYGGQGTAPNGYKRAVGCNIHVLLDKESRVMGVRVLPANLQDAEGARCLLPLAKDNFPALTLVLGDKAYRQRPLSEFAAELDIKVDGDSPPLPKGTTFKPMPMRWRVERFFSWLAKWRRIARNWCYSVAGFETDVLWSILGLNLRRLF